MVNRLTINVLLCVLSLGASSVTGERWSRQISNAGFVNVGNDWVPLSFPVNRPSEPQRQTSGRVLNFSPLPHHQPPYIPHVFQQQQQLQSQPELRQPQQLNFAAGEPFQVVGQQRYLLQPAPNPGAQFAQQLTPPSPTAPSDQHQLLFQPQPSSSAALQHFQQPQSSIQPPQLIQHQLPPAEINHQYQIQHYPSQQVQPQPSQAQQQQHHLPQQQHIQQATNVQVKPLQHAQYLQQQQQQHHQQKPQLQLHHQQPQHFGFPSTPTFLENEVPVELKPHQEQLVQRAPFVFHQEQEPKIQTIPPPQPPHESPHNQEEVQLLYVPLDTLYQQKPSQHHQQQPHPNNKYNVIPPPVNPLQINNFYTPEPSISQFPSTTSAPSFSSPSPSPAYERSTTHRFAQSPNNNPTPKPKIKSHQPPLAMFMLNDISDTEISVNDVLSALKHAKNIDVLDSASKKSPKVFVGPSGLRTPTGYTKFELPYLSSIEQNRAERQVTKLPFFVAPLSYKAPNGFAKIPLPAPHVGSVVVNMPAAEKNQFQQAQLASHPPPPPPPSPSPQRTQFYPKKVQHTQSPSTEYSIDKPVVYKSSSKPNLGFKFGSDVFTTTPRPYVEQEYPSSTRQQTAASTTDRYQQLYAVSSTQAPKEYEPFGKFHESQSTPSVRFHESTPSGRFHESPSTPSGRFQSSYTFESTSPPKNYESPNRFQDQVTYRNSKQAVPSTAFPSSTTTRYKPDHYQNYEENTTPQVPTFDQDYQQPNQFQPFAHNPKPAYSVFPSSTATSFDQQQPMSSSTHAPPSVNQEYQARNPYNTDVSAFRNFKPIPNQHVLNEEYFNVQKANEMKSFSHEETPLNTSQIQENYITNAFNQFQTTEDFLNEPKTGAQHVTNSAPKQTISENVYNDAHSRLKQVSPRPDVTYTSKPHEYSTRAQEIHKMKSYFREQEAFKNRPHVPVVSTAEPSYGPVSSTPNYSAGLSSSTPHHYGYEASTEISAEGITEKPSTPRSTVTYYTPAANIDIDSAPPVVQYKLVPSVVNKNYAYKGSDHQSDITTQTYEPKEYHFTTSSEMPQQQNVFANHPDAAVYDSSSRSPYVDYVKVTGHKKKFKQPIVESDDNEEGVTDKYAKNPFTLPSELPAISASLPGLVNSLYEDDERESRTTTVVPTTLANASVPRRTPTRGRRPQQATRVTVSRAPVTRAPTTPRPPKTTTSTSSGSHSYHDDDGSDLTTTTRRPINRGGRRPIHYANRTTTVRTPTARNPNRVRFNPTPEERQRFRSRSQKGGKKEEENLDYQRDVLNQNYPVIQRSGVPTTAAPSTVHGDRQPTTAISYAHETEKYGVGDADDAYVIPPNHSASPRDYLLTTPKVISSFDPTDHFAGLQDHHMQLPQEHDAGSQASYFNSEADVAAADILNSQKVEENHPVYHQSSSEVIQENVIEQKRPKRPNFAKRPIGSSSNVGQTLTTTATPQTATEQAQLLEKSAKERYTVRPKTRIDTSTVQYTPKARSVRIRTRPPTTTTTSTTTDAAPEVETYVDDSYHQINRFNKDFYMESSPQNHQPKGVRVTVSPVNEQKKYKFDKSRFALDTQESQWSTKLGQNSFHPVDPNDEKSSKSLKDSHESHIEPEIVTAGTVGVDEVNQDSYLLNVASNKNYVSFDINDDQDGLTKLRRDDLSSSTPVDAEPSFVDLLEQAMSDLGNEIVTKQAGLQDRIEVITTTSQPSGGTDETATTVANSRRRGVWKRVRVRPVDGFETAESQNIGNQIYNSILSNSSKDVVEANRNAQKGFKLYSYTLAGHLDEDEDEVVAQENYEDDPTVTKKPEDDTTTMYSSPGDIDLGTGAPVLLADTTVANRTVDVVATEESNVVVTTNAPDVIMSTTQIADEPVTVEDNVTTGATRRHDIEEEQEEPEETTVDKIDTVASTDTPYTEHTYYDDYDAEFKTENNVVADDEVATVTSMNDLAVAASDVVTPSDATNIIDEVKQKLTELFSFSDDYDYHENSLKPKVQPHRYTTIERGRPSKPNINDDHDNVEQEIIHSNGDNVTTDVSAIASSTEATVVAVVTPLSSFHRNLMDSVIYATSTSTEVSHETEICYRGRCIKTDRKN